MDVDQDLYPLMTKTEIKKEEIVESDSSSSTEELNLFINKQQERTETHQPAEILETESEVPLSSDSSFEASKKRKNQAPKTVKRRGKTIRKPASRYVPKQRARPALELRIVNKKVSEEPDFQCKTC